ncbi:MAG TPA: PadR family transcriptional regulator [Vicinamibacterales bacterium]|nr:PadR family transcriptional regulator [Vicinamibacterales bacterium]
MPQRSDKLSVIRGTLDVLVLQAVSARALHGFEISLWLDDHADQPLHIDDSALYQALHRLEARGYLKGEWGVSDNNRRARYYGLTAAGREHLAEERTRWMSYAATITALLATPRRTR